MVSMVSSENAMRINGVKRALIVVMLVVLIAMSIGMKLWSTRNPPSTKDALRFSFRQQRTIHLLPSGIEFQIPQDWVTWDSQFHNNLHLTSKELMKVQTGKGEWDSEYSVVVNAALPFEDCAAHVGGEGWGVEGSSFVDLQVRAYVTDLPMREILERVQKSAFAEAQRIANAEGGSAGNEAHVSISSDGNWRRAAIDYPLWYHDYGGTAKIDFYLRDESKYRLVLVFMGGQGNPAEEPAILESVVLPGK